MSRKASARPGEKQVEVLRFIIRHVEQHGYQPTQKEMAEHFNVTISAIQNRLAELEKRGYIVMKEQRERAIQIRFVQFMAIFNENEEVSECTNLSSGQRSLLESSQES